MGTSAIKHFIHIRVGPVVGWIARLSIDDLHATSRRPCWWNLNKRISLTSFVCGTNMAAKPLSSESQWIGCKSSINTL